MFMKRKNAVAAMIVLFICVAVYLNWSYTRGIGLDDAANVNSGKILGEATLADNEQKEDKTEDKKNEEAKKGEDKGSA
ncbi:MAG: hypothetical protein RSC43_08925, partial [Clostridia bacterium]